MDRSIYALPDIYPTPDDEWRGSADHGAVQVYSNCSGLIKGVDPEGYGPLILITISPTLPSDSE
jgi:hypothetical protein